MLNSGLAFALTGIIALTSATIANAGCGCEKPPPPPAGIRPNATWFGSEVRIFSEALVDGGSYDVRFTSGVGADTTTVAGTAVMVRDLADGVSKPQIVTRLPWMPLGPVGVEVTTPGSDDVMVSIDDAELTAIAAPIALPNERGEFSFPGYQAAVGRDGVTYLAFDLTDVTLPLVVRARALGYPLRFTGDDALFYNDQGFLMQTLDGTIPGLFAVEAGNDFESDALQYSRHEFNTHFLRHAERESHHLDPKDPNWHEDGSAHINHDLLVLAIAARLADGSNPAVGATPPFTLAVDAFSLFRHGLAATGDMELKNSMTSYGPVRSNALLRMSGTATVNGVATAASFDVSGQAHATAGYVTDDAEAFMPVDVPEGATPLGPLYIENNDVVVLEPGSYVTDFLIVASNASLMIDNISGPVTLYVTDKVTVAGTVSVTDADPEKFAIYVAGPEARFQNDMSFTGVLYAPDALVDISGHSSFYGAFVGAEVIIGGDVTVTYEDALDSAVVVGATTTTAPISDRSPSSGDGSGNSSSASSDDNDLAAAERTSDGDGSDTFSSKDMFARRARR